MEKNIHVIISIINNNAGVKELKTNHLVCCSRWQIKSSLIEISETIIKR